MNEHIAAMENLLRAKKENNKKEPTKSEKNQFRKNWTALVLEDGYTGKAEQFLYDGFGFCGAEPFYQFLKQSDDRENTIKQLFDGKHYGKNKDVTFRIITHLFALMLNDGASAHLQEPVIKHFPSACLNKEGKRLGTATKTLEKYFLNVLSPNAVLNPLNEMELNSEVIKSFLSVISALISELEQMDSIKEPATSNILRIEKWAKEYLGKSGKEGIQSENNAEGVTGTRLADETKISSTEMKQEIDVNSLDSILNQAKVLVSQLQQENDNQKKRITELKAKEHDNSLKLREVSKKLEDEKAAVAELRRQKCELESKCQAKQHEIENKDRMLSEKDAEIVERIRMSEVLSRDRSRQADESLQRIASKIRVEYRDFKDAVNTPMTVDLGENLRIQLQSVFEILEKGGMKIE